MLFNLKKKYMNLYYTRKCKISKVSLHVYNLYFMNRIYMVLWYNSVYAKNI